MKRHLILLVGSACVVALSGCGLLPRTGSLTTEEVRDAHEIANVVGFPVEELEGTAQEVLVGNTMEHLYGEDSTPVEDAYEAAKNTYFLLLDRYPELQATKAVASDPDLAVRCRQPNQDGSQTCGGSVLLVGDKSGTPLEVFFGFASSGSSLAIGTVTGPTVTFPAPITLPEAYEGEWE